ncbi:MAG: exodeoxyribonuclease VII small subunit [Lachnospiraceae bacterium]|jgi:exodeoxyribonuclease VII small subunit
MTEKKETRTIEEAMEALDLMVEKLESQDTSLEDSFQIYQEGMKLLKYCSDKIDRVEKKMLQMNEEGELREF